MVGRWRGRERRGVEWKVIRRGVREARGWRAFPCPQRSFLPLAPSEAGAREVADQMPKAQWEAARGRGRALREDRVLAIADAWRSGADQMTLPPRAPV